MIIPANHITEAQKLTADAYVDLFEIRPTAGGVVRVKNMDPVTWQGNDYESMPLQLSGFGENAGEEVSRPTLTVVNPDGVFSGLVSQGYLNRATVKRFRLLKADLDVDANVYIEHTWVVGRIASLTNQSISMELRNLFDGPNFILPRRTFSPPDFPAVNLR